MKNTKSFFKGPEQEKTPLEEAESIFSEIQVKEEDGSSLLSTNPYIIETQSIMNYCKSDPEYSAYNFLDPLTYNKIFSVERSPYLEQINVPGNGLIYSKQVTTPIPEGTVIGPALTKEYTEEFLKLLYGENIELVHLQYSLPAQPAEEESAENSSEIARSSKESNATEKQNRSPKIRLPTENMLQNAREKKAGLCPVYFANHRSNVLIHLNFSPIGVPTETIQKYLAGSGEGYILYKKTVYSVVNGKVYVLKKNASQDILDRFPQITLEKKDITIDELHIDVLYKDDFDLLESLNPRVRVPKRHNVEFHLMEYPPASKQYTTIWVSVDNIYPGDEITTSYGSNAQIDFQKVHSNSKRSLIYSLDDEEPIPNFITKIEDNRLQDIWENSIDHSESKINNEKEKIENGEIKEQFLCMQYSESVLSLINDLEGKSGSKKMRHLFGLPEKEIVNFLQSFENPSDLYAAFKIHKNEFSREKNKYPEKYKLLNDKNNFIPKYSSLAAEISIKASERFSDDNQPDKLVYFVSEALKLLHNELNKVKCFMSLSTEVFKKVTEPFSDKTQICAAFGFYFTQLSSIQKDFPQNFEILNKKSKFKFKPLSTSMVDSIFDNPLPISLTKQLITQRLTSQMQGFLIKKIAVQELFRAKEENFRSLLKFFDNKEDFFKSLGGIKLAYYDIVRSIDYPLAQQINYNLLKDKNNFNLLEKPVGDLSFLNSMSGQDLIKSLQHNLGTYKKSEKKISAAQTIKYFFGLFSANEGKFSELLTQFDSPSKLFGAFNLNPSHAMRDAKIVAPGMYELLNKMKQGVFKEDHSELDLSLAEPNKKMHQ